jgi:hypothetical protein
MTTARGRKAIFITGAASGMGLETARLFASEGWFVGGHDVNAAGLEALRTELGADNCLLSVLDVTDREAYRAAGAEIIATHEEVFARADLIVNLSFDTQLDQMWMRHSPVRLKVASNNQAPIGRPENCSNCSIKAVFPSLKISCEALLSPTHKVLSKENACALKGSCNEKSALSVSCKCSDGAIEGELRHFACAARLIEVLSILHTKIFFREIFAFTRESARNGDLTPCRRTRHPQKTQQEVVSPQKLSLHSTKTLLDPTQRVLPKIRHLVCSAPNSRTPSQGPLVISIKSRHTDAMKGNTAQRKLLNL